MEGLSGGQARVSNGMTKVRVQADSLRARGIWNFEQASKGNIPYGLSLREDGTCDVSSWVEGEVLITACRKAGLTIVEEAEARERRVD